MFTSPHECGLCTHHISSSFAPGLYLAAEAKGPQFLQKNPQQKFLAMGLCIHVARHLNTMVCKSGEEQNIK